MKQHFEFNKDAKTFEMNQVRIEWKTLQQIVRLSIYICIARLRFSTFKENSIQTIFFRHLLKVFDTKKVSKRVKKNQISVLSSFVWKRLK